MRDVELLSWVARFRFVTAAVLSERFSVTEQRVNARVRRLEAEGLVQRFRSAPTQAHAISVTRVGARRLGLPVRRAPRTDVQREHELLIASFVSRVERSGRGVVARTEREQRSLEGERAARFSVEVRPARPREVRRWPDVVLETPARRVAIEIELSEKAPERLRRIVAGYVHCSHYDEVRFLVSGPLLAARIARAAQAERRTHSGRVFAAVRGAAVLVQARPDADAVLRGEVRRALAAVESR